MGGVARRIAVAVGLALALAACTPGHTRPVRPRPLAPPSIVQGARSVSLRLYATALAPAVGQVLVATTGSWGGNPTSFTYQWERCDPAGHNCIAIAGATGSSYTVQSADAGSALASLVTAWNAQGSAGQLSPLTAAVTSSNGLLYGSQGGPYSSISDTWPGATWQPFASTSFWNTPLPDWHTATVTADSSNETTFMGTNWANHWTNWTFSNTLPTTGSCSTADCPSAWNQPVFYATASDPLYTIATTVDLCQAPQATFCPTKLRIPDGARHASGGDGSMSVVEPAGFYSAAGTDPQGRPAGEVDEVDFFQVQNTNPISGGGTLTNHGSGGAALDGPGCCGNANATNTALIGGSIRPAELAAGVIHHALNGSFKCANGQQVDPSTHTGPGTICAVIGGSPVDPVTGTHGDGPPMGARLQLKMDDSTIDGLFPSCVSNGTCWKKAIYTALAHYGIFLTDTGGSPMDPKFDPAADVEGFEGSPFPDSTMSFLATAAGGSHTDPFTFTFGDGTSTPSVPWSSYQVVDPCYSSTPPSC